MDWPSELDHKTFRFLVYWKLAADSRNTHPKLSTTFIFFYGVWITPVHDVSKKILFVDKIRF